MTHSNATRLFVVRHGETEWNVQGRFQGSQDSPLTKTGIEQAQQVGEALASEGISELYSSHLPRAARTAEEIGKRIGLAITIDEELRERSVGELEGQTRQALEQMHGQDIVKRIYQPDFSEFQSESLRSTQSRIKEATRSIAERHPGQSVCIVTHGAALNMLLRHTIGIPLELPRRFAIPNCAINVFRFESDQLTLERWGDIQHLKTAQYTFP